ncbi:hypothetical protein [Mycobacterium sp.]|uniref:hypothetical protein n=1 Tax=Mycobacterium sp. TaxID=1785 RepID=UPI001274846E|nr:hypothetical protein [Mycobacterium sp.]KAA8967508.1 MAG: hypothetical protein F6Q13_06020 [Mycobacterium sp.]
MRKLWRLSAFDVAAPLGTIAGLLGIGLVLGWPLWWVSACSMLVLLVVEGMVANFLGLRRRALTLGIDDSRPGLRLAVVAVCTTALVAAVALGYKRWTVPDRELKRDSAEVVQIASEVMVATGTIAPANPTASIDRAAAMVAPDHAHAFKEKFGQAAAKLASQNVSAEAATLAAGVEAIGPSAARVAVILRRTQNVWDQPPKSVVVAARVTLTKQNGHWMVVDVLPVHAR